MRRISAGRVAGFGLAAGWAFLAGCAAPDADSGSADAARSAAGMEAEGDSAYVLAGAVMQSLGGAEAWERTRFLAFRWIVERDGQIARERAHAWDRYDGRYRLEFERDGRQHVSLFNVNQVRRDSALGKVPAGDAWVDGEALSGEDRDRALAGAYSAFINDSYWLLMPFKWRDPGVHIAYEGRRILDDGREYAVVHLTFEPDLGVTEDQYWGFVDPETGRMAAWQYHLQNREEPGSVIFWDDWREVGAIRLAADRRWAGSGSRIRFDGLEAAAEVPPGRFDPPGS